MNFRKKIVLGVIIPTVFITAAIVVYEANEARLRAENPMHDLAEIIAKGQVDDLTLTIYYLPQPKVLYAFPITLERFLQQGDIIKTVVEGEQLLEYMSLLTRLSETDLIPVEKPSIDVRLYYMFEYRNHKIFDFYMWRKGNIFFVNDIAIKSDETFFDMVIPFLPDNWKAALEQTKLTLMDGFFEDS